MPILNEHDKLFFGVGGLQTTINVTSSGSLLLPQYWSSDVRPYSLSATFRVDEDPDLADIAFSIDNFDFNIDNGESAVIGASGNVYLFEDEIQRPTLFMDGLKMFHDEEKISIEAVFAIPIGREETFEIPKALPSSVNEKTFISMRLYYDNDEVCSSKRRTTR